MNWDALIATICLSVAGICLLITFLLWYKQRQRTEDEQRFRKTIQGLATGLKVPEDPLVVKATQEGLKPEEYLRLLQRLREVLGTPVGK